MGVELCDLSLTHAILTAIEIRRPIAHITKRYINVMFTCSLITDRINAAGNAIAYVRPSVRLFPLCLRNRLIVRIDLELFYGSRS